MLFTAFSSHLVKMMTVRLTETSVFLSLSLLCSPLKGGNVSCTFGRVSWGTYVIVYLYVGLRMQACSIRRVWGKAHASWLLSWSTSPKRSAGIQTQLRRCELWQSSLAVYLLPRSGAQADQGTHSLNSLLSSPHPLSPKCPHLVFVLDH